MLESICSPNLNIGYMPYACILVEYMMKLKIEMVNAPKGQQPYKRAPPVQDYKYQ